MELATFSDIEFVGIAADRHVVLKPTRRERRDSCEGSSTISLMSGGSEIERHDQSLGTSAFNIREVYTVGPSSPSAFVVDLVPETPTRLMDDVRDSAAADEKPNLPAASSCSSHPSAVLPLERYRRDSQRHERVAVSVALGHACNLAVLDDAPPAFWRSAAPSPSTHLGRLQADAARHGTVGDASTDQSVADPDECDPRSLLGTYSLERWFGSHMEKSDELAVELQQNAAQALPPCPTQASHQDPTSAPATQAPARKAEHRTTTHSSSISLEDFLEPEPPCAAAENQDTNESIGQFQRAFSLKSKDTRNRVRNRTHRDPRVRGKGKRKSDEDHPQSRPRKLSPAQVAEKEE